MNGSPDAGNRPAGFVGARAAALLVFIVALDLWLTHHFGLGVRHPGLLAGVVAAASTALAFTTKLLNKAEKEQIHGGLRRGARLLLSGPLVGALYLTGASVLATVTTVTVVSEVPGARGPVQLTYVDQPSQGWVDSLDSDGLVRFTLVTTPFGRPIRVTANGFVPTTFSVYPLMGLTVRLGHEVPLAPSVLFRPGILGLRALANGGSFRVWVVTPSGTTLIAETTAVRSSFLLGTPHSIPASMIEDWRLELTGMPDNIRDQTLLAWKRPVRLPRAASPGPGSLLLAEIFSRAGVRVATTEVVLGAERLLDVAVLDLAVQGGGE